MGTKTKSQLIFSIVLLAYILSFMVLSLELQSLSRRFPLIVASITAVFLIIKIMGILQSPNRMRKVGSPSASTTEKVFKPWREAAPTIYWTVGLLIGLYVFGLVSGSIIFTFFYVKFWGKHSIPTTLLSTVIVTILVYVLFGIIMKFQMFSGLLQIKLPFIFNT